MKEMLQLLERYYDGLTTPEEERRLREWLESDGCPEAYIKDRDAMRLLAQPGPATVPDGMAERLARAVRHSARRRVLRWTGWGMVAGVALVLAIGIALREPSSPAAGQQKALAVAQDTVTGAGKAKTAAQDSVAATGQGGSERPVLRVKPKRGVGVRRPRPMNLPPARYFAEKASAADGPAPATADMLALDAEPDETSPEYREMLRRAAVEQVRELLEMREYARQAIAQGDLDFSSFEEDDDREPVVIE